MTRKLMLAALWLLACSCGNNAPVAEDLGAHDRPISPSGQPEQCSRPAFLDAYGPPVTVAGTGAIGRKGDNGWQAAMEGNLATRAELSRPHIAMADASGAIYVADKDAHAIRKIATDGTITTVAGISVAGDDGDTPGPATQRRLDHPNGLWVMPDGTLYILDLGNRAIRRVDTAGTMTTIVRPSDGISIGRGLWVADDESHIVIASSDRVLEWTEDGGVTTIAAGFRQLGNLYRIDSGDLLATDRSAGRVVRISPSGVAVTIAGGGTRTDDCAPATEIDLQGARGVWPYAGGYFVATPAGSSIWFIDANGFGHPVADGSDGIDEVRAITVDTAGRLIIVDGDAGYVRVMAPPS